MPKAKTINLHSTFLFNAVNETNASDTSALTYQPQSQGVDESSLLPPTHINERNSSGIYFSII